MIEGALPFLALAVFGVPWFLIVRERCGYILAALAVTVCAALGVLALFTVSFLLSTDPVLLTLGCGALAGVAGFVMLRTRRIRIRRPGRLAVASVLGASAGGIVWFAALVIARMVHGTAALGWSMRGDSANQIHTTRDMFDMHGFLLGTGNPVPLQNELLTIAAWIGRPTSLPGDVVRHDVQALSIVWALSISAMGLAMGVIGASLLSRPTPALTVVCSAGASLLTTTWFFSGLAIDSGYFNVHVALPFVLASWLAYLQHTSHPITAALILLGCGVLVLASWSPLVVFPLVLVAAIAQRNWSRIRESQSRRALPVAFALVVFAAILTVLYFPKLAEGFGSLSAPGHGYPLTIALLALAALATLVGAVTFRRTHGDVVVRNGIIALSLACGAGLGALLLIARDEPNPWLTYYPTKFTWQASVTVLVVLLSLVFALLSTVRPERLRVIAVAVVSTGALITSTLGPAPYRQDFTIVQPLTEVVGGSTWTGGEAALDRIVQNLNRDVTVVLWRSGIPEEGFINFWVLDFSGASATDGNNYVRAFSVESYRALRDTGSTDHVGTIDFLCGLPDHLEQPLTVQTADSSLAATLRSECPTSRINVESVSPLLARE